jgi:hypothetical protein
MTPQTCIQCLLSVAFCSFFFSGNATWFTQQKSSHGVTSLAAYHAYIIIWQCVSFTLAKYWCALNLSHWETRCAPLISNVNERKKENELKRQKLNEILWHPKPIQTRWFKKLGNVTQVTGTTANILPTKLLQPMKDSSFYKTCAVSIKSKKNYKKMV